jgi:hypothetical protein
VIVVLAKVTEPPKGTLKLTQQVAELDGLLLKGLCCRHCDGCDEQYALTKGCLRFFAEQEIEL